LYNTTASHLFQSITSFPLETFFTVLSLTVIYLFDQLTSRDISPGWIKTFYKQMHGNIFDNAAETASALGPCGQVMLCVIQQPPLCSIKEQRFSQSVRLLQQQAPSSGEDQSRRN